MLSWSNEKYKLTLGVGALGIAGMFAELWRGVIPMWAALAVAFLPMVVFVFVHPGELPDRLVRIAHVAASVWYSVVGAGLLAAFMNIQPLPKGWPVCPLFLAVGGVLCATVLYRAVRGSYQPPGTPEAAHAKSGAARGGRGTWRATSVGSNSEPRSGDGL